MNPQTKDISKYIARIALFFIPLYALILFLWLHIEPIYNTILTEYTMNFFTWYFDFHVDSLDSNGKRFTYLLSDARTLYNQFNEPFHFQYSLSFALDIITYNIPMTLSAVLALIITQAKSKLDYLLLIHVIVLLILLHCITIYFVVLGATIDLAYSKKLLQAYLQEHTLLIHDRGYIKLFLVQYGIRFEPFLMMVYTWFKMHSRR